MLTYAQYRKDVIRAVLAPTEFTGGAPVIRSMRENALALKSSVVALTSWSAYAVCRDSGFELSGKEQLEALAFIGAANLIVAPGKRNGKNQAWFDRKSHDDKHGYAAEKDTKFVDQTRLIAPD
jgi:hypothetical protein